MFYLVVIVPGQETAIAGRHSGTLRRLARRRLIGAFVMTSPAHPVPGKLTRQTITIRPWTMPAFRSRSGTGSRTDAAAGFTFGTAIWGQQAARSNRIILASGSCCPRRLVGEHGPRPSRPSHTPRKGVHPLSVEQREDRSLRIVSWNCNMALGRKAGHLLALQPDIAVVLRPGRRGARRPSALVLHDQ